MIWVWRESPGETWGTQRYRQIYLALHMNPGPSAPHGGTCSFCEAGELRNWRIKRTMEEMGQDGKRGDPGFPGILEIFGTWGQRMTGGKVETVEIFGERRQR